MSTILMSSTPSHLMAGAIAPFHVTFAPFPAAAEHEAGYGRKFQPRWFNAIPLTVVDPCRSVRRRFLDPLI
ncbi:hypothetical protein AB0L88_28385 [Saccharopolyspora shandongensis]|uniref:Uncharacterized protein n=1 Tax=Saccharopolyspora shandongensis TaxID=418495 RepID=A0A1H2VBC5_9PSEU|nr:hypothetical protein [Saccharopolyspora shandongensis]SDW65560.1 hypothetical protein SAMN05216215_1004261 [Saccharopolyspora shandongensis]